MESTRYSLNPPQTRDVLRHRSHERGLELLGASAEYEMGVDPDLVALGRAQARRIHWVRPTGTVHDENGTPVGAVPVHEAAEIPRSGCRWRVADECRAHTPDDLRGRFGAHGPLERASVHDHLSADHLAPEAEHRRHALPQTALHLLTRARHR